MSELNDLLAKADDLGAWERAVARERAIRDGMARTSEGRTAVAETLDALESMDREAVLDLTDGEPTTLKDALERYAEDLVNGNPVLSSRSIAADLEILLAYPWSGEEAVLATHVGRPGLRLEVDHLEDNSETFVIRMGGNRAEVYRGSGDREGALIAEEVAYAVHRAVLTRVIGDREHIVQMNWVQVQDLRSWLERPSGSLTDQFNGRATFEASGNGIWIRTRPYAWAAGGGAVVTERRHSTDGIRPHRDWTAEESEAAREYALKAENAGPIDKGLVAALRAKMPEIESMPAPDQHTIPGVVVTGGGYRAIVTADQSDADQVRRALDNS